MAELNVRLRAEIDDLKSKLKVVRKELLKTGESVEDVDDALKRLDKIGGNGFKKTSKGAANATPAVLEFSRVIQDAPFGIQGVANNIQQLTANFGHLSKSAGGTKNALKLMIRTLSGPAGILLAVSAVTALMVAFGSSLKGAGDDAKDLNKILEDLNDKFSFELSTSKLLEENAKLQGKEFRSILDTRLRILQAQLQEVQGLILARKELLKINKEAQETVNHFDAISQSAVVTAGALTLSLTKGLGSAFQEQVDFLDTIVKGFADVLGISIDYNKLSTATKGEKEEEAELTEELKKLENQRLQIENNRLKLLQDINKEQAKAVVSLGSPDLSNIFGGVDLQSKITAFSNSVRKGLGDVFNKPLADSVKKVKPQLSNLEQALLDFNDRMDELIVNGFTNTLSGIGSAIGTALVQGGNVFEAVGKSLLSSFGALLSQLGEMMIQMGLSLVLAKAALKSLNPALAIAGGVALVAIGAAFSASTQGAAGSFGGGGVAGQGSGSSVSTPNNFATSGSLNQTVVFEIAGTKLLGVLQNTQDRNLRLGG